MQLNRIFLTSKRPNCEAGPLNATFIPLPERNSILILKEVAWESMRFEADGLDENMTPVKAISNRGRLCVVIKKNLPGKISVGL